MEVFFKGLEKIIAGGIVAEFSRLLERIGNEKIYAVALVTDGDCITLRLSANTYEYLVKHDEYLNKKYGADNNTKWLVDEWGYHDDNESKLAKISSLLYERGAEVDTEEAFLKWRRLFLETASSAFRAAVFHGAFNLDSDTVCLIAETDSDSDFIVIPREL